MGSGNAGSLQLLPFQTAGRIQAEPGETAAHIPQRALFKASPGSGEQLRSKPENLPGTSRAGMAEPGKALGSAGMGAGILKIHTSQQIHMTILSYLYSRLIHYIFDFSVRKCTQFKANCINSNEYKVAGVPPMFVNPTSSVFFSFL